eukprot:7388065-Prymnesium_polylepis.1
MAGGALAKGFSFCFSGFLWLLAFVFLRGGPSAEAGQFLRRSRYIANKGRDHGQHGQHGQRGQSSAPERRRNNEECVR